MRTGHVTSPGTGAAGMRAASGKPPMDGPAETSRLAYAKPGSSAESSRAALRKATASSQRLDTGKATSRSRLGELASSFRCAIRDLLLSVRERVRPGKQLMKSSEIAKPVPKAAKAATAAPYAGEKLTIKMNAMALGELRKSTGTACPSIPRLLHYVCAGKDFSRSTVDSLMKEMPQNSRQEGALIRNVLELLQSLNGESAGDRPEIDRDSPIVEIARQLSSLLPDDIKEQCAGALDGLSTDNLAERRMQIAALLSRHLESPSPQVLATPPATS